MRRLSGQSVQYQVSKRVSLPQLLEAMKTFFGEPSGGLRPLVVTATMMDVLGKEFSIFARIVSQGINQADAPLALPET